MVAPRSPVRTLRAAVPRSSRTSTPWISARGRETRSAGAAAVGAEGHQQVVGGHEPGLPVAAVEPDVRGYREAELLVGADDPGQLPPDPRRHRGAKSPLCPAAFGFLHLSNYPYYYPYSRVATLIPEKTPARTRTPSSTGYVA